MRTKEELNAIKEELEVLRIKLRELSEEELAQITGGTEYSFHIPNSGSNFWYSWNPNSIDNSPPKAQNTGCYKLSYLIDDTGE